MKNTLILEIGGEDCDFSQYRESLQEALNVDIHRVFFACIWSGSEEYNRKVFRQIVNFCDDIRMEVLSYTAGYYDKMFDGPMVGSSDEDGVLNSACEWVEFEKYKLSQNVSVCNGAKVIEKIR